MVCKEEESGEGGTHDELAYTLRRVYNNTPNIPALKSFRFLPRVPNAHALISAKIIVISIVFVL